MKALVQGSVLLKENKFDPIQDLCRTCDAVILALPTGVVLPLAGLTWKG